MNKNSISILIALALLSVAPAFSQEKTSGNGARPSLHDVFPALSADQLQTLSDRGELTDFYKNSVEVKLAPATPMWDHAKASLETLEPSVGVEALFLYPLPAQVMDRPDFDLWLYNILRSVSTMEGIQYYSASRGHMRTFYIESYVVDGPDSRNHVPDPLVKKIPATDTIYTYQRDSSFGRNIYKVDYRFQDNSFSVSMKNLTPMFYGILPILGKENLEIHLAIIPTSEGLAFYGNAGVKVLSLFGLEDRVKDSFYNRIKAIYGWFSDQVKQ